MEVIVKMKTGSHLFGTNTPDSDTDITSIHIPDTKSILLGKTKQVINTSIKKERNIKNTSEDIDNQSISLQKFFDMIIEGDMIATEMLFAPSSTIIESSDKWEFIKQNKKYIINKQCKGFVSYCRRMANKYGIRGGRVSTIRNAITLINTQITDQANNQKLRIGDFKLAIQEFVNSHEHTSIINIPTPLGKELLHWDVCDRKFPYTVSVKEALNVLEKIFKEYGHRAMAAEKNEGIDWKAMSHAVRVGEQAIELLTYGTMSMPRPNAEELIAIKLGRIPYSEIASRLESLLENVETASRTSFLPEKSDRDWIDNLLIRWYTEDILNFSR